MEDETMKKVWKKATEQGVCLALSCAMMLSLTACGSTDGSSASSASSTAGDQAAASTGESEEQAAASAAESGEQGRRICERDRGQHYAGKALSSEAVCREVQEE